MRFSRATVVILVLIILATVGLLVHLQNGRQDGIIQDQTAQLTVDSKPDREDPVRVENGDLIVKSSPLQIPTPYHAPNVAVPNSSTKHVPPAAVCPHSRAVPVFQEGGGDTFKKKTFCHDFLVNTFHDEVPVCGGQEMAGTDQVKCYGSVYTKHIAMCSYENVALKPKQLLGMIPSDVKFREPESNTLNLLQNRDFNCEAPNIDSLMEKTDHKDLEVELTRHLLNSERLSPSVCDVWINKTTFFHVSNALHIYFRFMDLYSLHKGLTDYGVTDDNHQVLRIGNMGSGYRFPEFDKAVFPGALTLSDLQEHGTVCFKKVVFTPRSYQSIPFRCKMNGLLRNRCFQCNGKGLTGSPFYTFRTRVLKACNITNFCKEGSHLTLISRKPYERWHNDDPKKFQRVLLNENQMIEKIKQTFPSLVVKVLHMEELNVCEQVQSAIEADVLMGVHGAGLVHFWWLREEATALELEPSFEAGNPSFKMLTTLTGRKYVVERIGGAKAVSVNINSLIQTLKRYF